MRMRQWVSASEAMRRTGISSTELRRLVDAGLVAVRSSPGVGRPLRRYDARMLVAALEAITSTGPDALPASRRKREAPANGPKRRTK
jgi:predicted ArsR family transcriptional regulator